MKRQGRLARLEQAAGMVRCPHCGGWIGPEARQRTEQEAQTNQFWKAATVEELRQVRDIIRAIRARLGEGEGICETPVTAGLPGPPEV
jgi:hypothetical protein